MFVSGDVLRLTGAEKGGRILDDREIDIDATTTVADFMAALEEALGIDTSVGSNPGGVSIDDTTGVITIEGNYGTENELTVETSDLVRLDSTGTQLGQPFLLTAQQEAAGESVRTTFRIYDSLGNPVDVDLTLVLDSKSDTGTTWRYFVDSDDSVGTQLSLGTGTLSFDTTGRLIPPSQVNIQIDRSDTGANNPLSVTLDFDEDADIVTALTSTRSEVSAVFQDGSSMGTLADFAVEGDGRISGTFTNGLLRTIGQVVISTFTNPGGLVDLGNLQYSEGPNSGESLITTPLSAGSGRVVSGSLELSNVDLSQEFINLILASTGYTASSRVINTANTLFQQLLVLGR
jgi:flagellar hook protein FlgE